MTSHDYVVFCPKCNAKGNDIVITAYEPEPVIEEVSMDNLEARRASNRYTGTSYSHSFDPIHMMAKCTKCDYTVTWEEPSFYITSTSVSIP